MEGRFTFENFLTQSSHFTGELERVSHKEGRRREGLPRSGGIDKKNTIVANTNTKDCTIVTLLIIVKQKLFRT